MTITVHGHTHFILCIVIIKAGLNLLRLEDFTGSSSESAEKIEETSIKLKTVFLQMF